jgi:hypothetical protein
MSTQPITREQILAAIKAALEPRDDVNAMWEGGAASFKRVDEWSDIDLQVDVADARVAEVIAATEHALASLAPIALRYEFPQPTWHGHAQIFYRLRDASDFLLLDFVVIQHSHANKFLEPAIHGNAVVHFDKANVVAPPPFDANAHRAKLRARVETLRVTFELFRVFVLKELNRHNDVEALMFYHSFTLRPLVEVLRIQHAPTRYNFHTRYVYSDLPAQVVRELEPLFFVAHADDLRAKRERAEGWFRVALEQICWE